MGQGAGRVSATLFTLQQRLQGGERIAGRIGHLVFRVERAAAGVIDIPRVLVVVAIDAQQFPVASIGRVEIVIVVPMVHGQLLQVGPRELPTATAADPRIHLQRPLAITLAAPLGIARGAGDDAVEFGVVYWLVGGHRFVR